MIFQRTIIYVSWANTGIYVDFWKGSQKFGKFSEGVPRLRKLRCNVNSDISLVYSYYLSLDKNSLNFYDSDCYLKCIFFSKYLLFLLR